MAEKVEKIKFNIWIDKNQVEKIDKICKKEDRSRATVVRDALNAYFEKENKEDLHYEVITAKLESIEAKTESQATLLLEAIKNQPIAVQQQLPEVSEKPHKSFRGLFKRKESK